MTDFSPFIRRAMESIGVSPKRIADVMAGGELYGENGVLDSLDFVRFLSELTQLLNGIQIDLFDIIETLDAGLPDTFRTVESLGYYLNAAVPELAQ